MSTFASSIQSFAVEHAEKTAREMGETTVFVPAASSEIVDQITEGTHTTVWFVFDFMILHRVQSGSDWYTHVVYSGTATFEGDARLGIDIEKRRQSNANEWEMEWAPEAERYDHDAVRDKDRDAWWATVKATRG